MPQGLDGRGRAVLPAHAGRTDLRRQPECGQPPGQRRAVCRGITRASRPVLGGGQIFIEAQCEANGLSDLKDFLFRKRCNQLPDFTLRNSV